jgi:hypothetical protein
MINTRLDASLLRRRGLALLLVFAMSLQLSGCGFMGYATFKTDVQRISEPLPNLENIKIAYPIYYPKPKYWRELSFALTRTLQTQFKILDIHSNEHGAFALYTEIATKGSMENPPALWGIIHLLSFSTIPISWSENNSITFTLYAPNGDKKTFTYGMAIRCYSWLPFMFFNPKIMDNLSRSIEYYQEDRVNIFEKISTRFMVDAAPFFLAHATPVKH